MIKFIIKIIAVLTIFFLILVAATFVPSIVHIISERYEVRDDVDIYNTGNVTGDDIEDWSIVVDGFKDNNKSNEFKDDYNIDFEYLKIDEADIDDAKEILRLQKKAYISEAEIINDFTIQPLTQTLDEIIEEVKNQFVLKAFVTDGKNIEDRQKNGRIIGSVRGYQKDDTCYIGKLIVNPEYQNVGLGKELINLIEKRFKEALRFELFTGEKSEKNIRFYTRLGYKFIKTEKISEKLNLVFMEKIIPVEQLE